MMLEAVPPSPNAADVSLVNDHAQLFIERVLPWAPLGDPNAYGTIHFTIPGKQDGDRPIWVGRAAGTPDELLKEVNRAAKNEPNKSDIYVCMSTQRLVQRTQAANGYEYTKAKRSAQNAVHLRSLFLDIDVKGDGYATTRDAATALKEFLENTGMPRPSMIVGSGSGGMHVYWCLDEALTPAQWQPLAQGLVEATKQAGLLCDTQVTVDAARILRVPGTTNWKGGKPKPVQLHIASIVNEDYSVEYIRRVLAPYVPARPALSPAQDNVNSELTSGIVKQARPVDLRTVAEAGCGFIEEALDTGGSGFDNPLWNLTTLAATFAEDGREIAHEMAKGHPTYDPDETDALYDRKLQERQEKNLGWPSCQTVHNAGCKHCGSCWFLPTGKSPLHLGKRTTPNADGPPPLRALNIADIPEQLPPRAWMHGTDIIRGTCTLVVSPGGRGKTATLIGIGLACASGRNLMGAKVFGGRQRVLYINTEDGSEEVSRRTRAAIQSHGLSDAEVEGFCFAGVDTARMTLLASVRGEHRLNEHQWTRFRELIKRHKPDLVILDPLANLSAHTLNDNAAATTLMAEMTSLAVEMRLAIVIAHHTGKGRDLTSQDAAMGASALVNSARAVMSIDTLNANDANDIGVMPSQAQWFFRLISVKGNLSPPSPDDRWYELTSFNLGNGTETYPAGDNVQVVKPFKASTQKPAFSDEKILAALTAIHAASPPLSPNKQARARYAGPIIEKAIEAVGPLAKLDAQALLGHLTDQGLVQEAEVQVPKSSGKGTNKRQGLVLTEAGRARMQDLEPQSPQSALSPTEANEASETRLAL